MSGGGSKAPSNTTSTVNQNTIPKFAEPYAMQMLGQTNALTQTGYQPYQGQRIAGFNPLQEQAYQGYGGMQVSPGLQQAGGLAGMAALGGMNTGRWTDPGVAQSYMSPYMENVVRSQQQDASRQAAIANRGLGARAATSGAFGGSRHALENAEANRNLGTQLGDIRAKGLQSAYDTGANIFGQDEARRLQGYGTAMQGAGILGQLAGDEFGQQMSIYDKQAGAGKEMQGLEQQILGTNYQDFLDRLNYPYKQLGFFSDMLHGIPTQQSSTVYGPQGSTAAQAAGTLGGLGSLYMGSKAGG